MRERHTFQCSNCKTVLVTVLRHSTRPGGHYSCTLCFQWMRHLWSEPITEDGFQAALRRGPQFNPGVAKERPHCAVCGKDLDWFTSDRTRRAVSVPNVGDCCPGACATSASKARTA